MTVAAAFGVQMQRDYTISKDASLQLAWEYILLDSKFPERVYPL